MLKTMKDKIKEIFSDKQTRKSAIICIALTFLILIVGIWLLISLNTAFDYVDTGEAAASPAPVAQITSEEE